MLQLHLVEILSDSRVPLLITFCALEIIISPTVHKNLISRLSQTVHSKSVRWTLVLNDFYEVETCFSQKLLTLVMLRFLTTCDTSYNMNWSDHNFIICYDSLLWLIANSLYLLSNHFIFAMLASHLTRLSNKFVFNATHFFYFRSVGILWSTRVLKESFSRFENLLLIQLQGLAIRSE